MPGGTTGRQRVGRVRLDPRPGESGPRAPRPPASDELHEKHLTLPSHPAMPKARVRSANGRPASGRSMVSRISQRLSSRWQADPSWDRYVDPDDDAPLFDDPRPRGPRYGSGYGRDDAETRTREQSVARPIGSRAQATNAHTAARIPAVSDAPTMRETARQRALVAVAPGVPDAMGVAVPRAAGMLARTPARTRAIIKEASKKASSPWAVARTMIVLCAMVIALIGSLTAAGDPGFSPPTYKTGANSTDIQTVASKVQPITQLIRCDEYDSQQQCQDYGNAACSAAATTEVLTAWGVPKMTIGRVIDEFGDDISMYGGLLTHAGFQRVAALHAFRADQSTKLTYNQMLYITNTLGIPLIVDVRISYGYYSFFAGGHFLVMTGGDQNGVSIADSSEYYIHYLPKDIFYSMFTGQTTLLVPTNYQYTLPSN